MAKTWARTWQPWPRRFPGWNELRQVHKTSGPGLGPRFRQLSNFLVVRAKAKRNLLVLPPRGHLASVHLCHVRFRVFEDTASGLTAQPSCLHVLYQQGGWAKLLTQRLMQVF